MDVRNDGEVKSPETAPAASGRNGTSAFTLFVLSGALLYSALALYTGTFLPLRLVKGVSMEPALGAGDIVVLKKRPFSAIRVGDVVAYRTPDLAQASVGAPRAILHRVTKARLTENGLVLTTRGDNSDTDPWPVTAADYRGTQAMRIPLLGKPLVFFSSPRGLLFVAVGTLITLLYFPAMMIFHMTVLRKPEKTTALALREGAALAEHGTESASDPPLKLILAAVSALTEEQQQIRGSLSELSKSIAFNATNLTSHTEVVQNLAEVARLLGGAIQEGQGIGTGRRALMFAVMIVDDQEPFRKRARDVLEMEGDFRIVAEASDGAEALEKMEQARPDLVLMDVQMPQMNGFEATRRIQERYPGTIVALVSMTGEPEYTRMAQEVGARGFISKKELSVASIRQVIQGAEPDKK